MALNLEYLPKVLTLQKLEISEYFIYKKPLLGRKKLRNQESLTAFGR